MTSISVAEYHELLKNNGKVKKKKPKYRNNKVTVDGYLFDSIRESERYQELVLLQKAGEIKYFLRQVPFHLAPDLKYLLDFLIVWSDGSITYEDAKGFHVRDSINKIKMVREKYKISVELV